MYELRRSRTNCDYSPKGWKWASGVWERGKKPVFWIWKETEEKNSCENFPVFTAA